MNYDWVRESNLIENVDDPLEDERGRKVFNKLIRKNISVTTIKWLHKSLMVKLNREIGGKFRRCNVQVGGYVAPHWIEVPDLMAEWVLHWSSAATPEDIKRAHVAFESIHPFEDGNGRTGRMIMNWQRNKAWLIPLCIKASERHVYYEWFRN